MKHKTCLEEKVLDYWFTLEFLGQDKYPQKELIDASHEVKILKKKLLNNKKGYKSIFDFCSLNPHDNLYSVLKQEAEQCHMKKWGNITVYIGKVKRESCIKCIAKILPFENEEDERAEKNFDDIACVSLQLTPDGRYIEHSLSLSTIVWAMNKIKNCTEKISDCLDETNYISMMEDMERKFFFEKNLKNHQNADITPNDKIGDSPMDEQETTKIDISTEIQEFDPDAVQLSVFKKIYDYIEITYLKDNIEKTTENKSYELIIDISFQMFADEDTKRKEEDDNYLGLSHDYFSDDLKMLLNKVRNRDKNVPKYVLDYISSTSKAIKNPEWRRRIDLIHPSNRNEFEKQIQEILNVKNAPIGKWPSKYMPVFMQQVAINLAIRKGTSPLFERNDKIFSVNGPPGTGKTTMLKEIIVNNIIERAILLAQYDNPDDAFQQHTFLHGSKPNSAYSQYTRYWYSFKDDRINDYSVLVTSCNNAAVENISKELPLGNKIWKDMKPSNDDSHEITAALNEVSNLFDFSKSLDIESYDRNTLEHPDIYFTYYSQQLLKNKNAWGLIAASLGKRKNIRDFYKAVLAPLRWDFYPTKDSISKRLPKYEEAKKNFLAQEKLVRELQKQISHVCDLAYKQSKLKNEICDKEKEYRQYLSAVQSRKTEIAELIKETQTNIISYKATHTNISNRMKKLATKKLLLKFQKQESEDKLTTFRQESLKTINSVGKRPFLFGRNEYEQKLQYAQRLAMVYDRQAEEQTTKIKELSFKLQKTENEYNAMSNKLSNIEEILTDLNAKAKTYHTESIELDRVLQYKQQLPKDYKKELEKVNIEYASALKRIGDGRELNQEFIGELLSKNTDIVTKAQTTTPWFTQTYNREREKLFYYAMKMNKEFILSSKKCRDNFTTLTHYWGLQPGDEKEKIIFHKEDRERCVGALYQTLFLLVPVISTTFASVGTFLKDVKDSQVIGTLIVDEAGQAQPQMAVGALYRSRKAIIVGDPKQVQPVVTDDLKLLKKAFDDEDLKPYISSKTISVQSCADEMNEFGTYLENPEHPDFPDWIGCPLLVHRRCIAPMYEISNTISYNGIMKQKTEKPSIKLEQSFIYNKSQWIHIEGKEKGNKNHFVAAQADKVCEMLEIAFSKSDYPNLYIISPFTTVVSGIRFYIKKYKQNHPSSSFAKCQKFNSWILNNIGTVHTFQGKEANEVIFLLGCDSSKASDSAVRWVNSNIVNVATTRAKFRLYIIGDAKVWSNNNNLLMAKNIIDTFAIKEIYSILADETIDSISKNTALNQALRNLPSATSFSTVKTQENDKSIDYSINTDNLIVGLEAHSFMNTSLSPEQLSKFGFSSQEQLEKFSPKIKKNLELGMKLYYILRPIYEVNKDFDASCCAILFCKAFEFQIKECFYASLQDVFYDVEINTKLRKNVKLKDVCKNEITLANFKYIIKKYSSVLGRRMEMMNKPQYNNDWWCAFEKKLSSCIKERNTCCHDSLFKWKNLSRLLADMFKESKKLPKLDGLMFESEIGKLI